MAIHLEITGILLIALALVHAIFPRRFEWKTQLASLTLINQQLMYVHTFFIALVLLLAGTLCITSSTDLLTTPLGRRLSLGFCIFWATRLFFQFFVYSPRLWKGKTMETTLHILASLLWTYFTAVFFLSYYSGTSGSH